MQAAIEAGDKAEVERLLSNPPEGISKSQRKAWIKQAEITAKKLEKAASKPTPAAPTAKKGGEKHQPPHLPSSSLPPPPPSSSGMPVGAGEGAIVELLLTQLQALGLPAEALSTCREHHAALSLAIAPELNAMRNEAYVMGFNAHLP